MKSEKILYTSAEVRKAIIDIFSTSKGRRVAITAFVGSGAEAYLPRPQGIELVCWPKAGGTNPDALRKLMKSGVKVSFADALHMKVYWTEDKGAVITSANLSTNALGAGDLREFGILVPSKKIDINKILHKIQPRNVTQKEILSLEKMHRDYQVGNKTVWNKSRQITFLDWYDFANKPKWKIGYWEETKAFSLSAKKVSSSEFGVRSPFGALACYENSYKKEDWVLTFRLSSKKPTTIEWMPVDFIVKVSRSDKKAYDRKYPFDAVQVWSINKYPPPPFKIDKGFRLAFAAALEKFGVTKFKEADLSKPPKRLIELIWENY